jgi:hypothetical protein
MTNKRVVEQAHERKDFYQEVDGYWVWDTGEGFLTAPHLRALADELDRLNYEWDKSVKEYFDGEQ